MDVRQLHPRQGATLDTVVDGQLFTAISEAYEAGNDLDVQVAFAEGRYTITLHTLAGESVLVVREFVVPREALQERHHLVLLELADAVKRRGEIRRDKTSALAR
jgi:hypothetical protein